MTIKRNVSVITDNGVKVKEVDTIGDVVKIVSAISIVILSVLGVLAVANM
ncbi:MAG: hypothetical protein K6A30_02935 [Lachnospiraceae bacterium]|nr:hypothetical protein [Lachnospiraceae bacterium]